MTSKNKRGFAAMEPDEQRRMASKGGRDVHNKGRSGSERSDRNDDRRRSSRSSRSR